MCEFFHSQDKRAIIDTALLFLLKLILAVHPPLAELRLPEAAAALQGCLRVCLHVHVVSMSRIIHGRLVFKNGCMKLVQNGYLCMTYEIAK